jgi:hypothetical protein
MTRTTLLVTVLLAVACGTQITPSLVLDASGPEMPGVSDVLDGQAGNDLSGPDVIDCVSGAECTVSNAFGACPGTLTCDPTGEAICDGPEPAEETCDGLDNDCDGTIDDFPCDDGDNCTGADLCLDGVCAGTTLDCDDLDPCTVDSCDSTKGCTYTVIDGVVCDDGDSCTEDDHCVDGGCVGKALICDDQDPCTMDYCSPADGCRFDPTSGNCDDDDPCTVDDACVDGLCVGTAVDCQCLADADCADLDDNDLCNGTLVCDVDLLPHLCIVDPDTVIECPEPDGADAPCLAPACAPDTGTCSFVSQHEDGACDDGNACTILDSCHDGICQGGGAINCDDNNPCTTDLCDPVSGCLHNPNTAPCSDGNACTLGDTCSAGQCQPGDAVVCDDNDVCTNDACDPDAGCVHTPNTLPCDDGNACTLPDTCGDGVCLPGETVSCDDNNPCTTDVCDPALGCSSTPNALPCDDGNACTADDLCQDGACSSGKAVVCDDNDVCTDDLCDPETGCQYPANSASCDDGNACTTEDTCTNGTCAGVAPLDCDDDNVCTEDSCLPAQGCQHDPVAGPCSDGDGCTLDDACKKGTCVGGLPKDCDDDNVCTADSCSDGDCQYSPVPGPCDDANACTTQDTCDAGLCTGGPSLDCDDQNPCTDDSCDVAAGCQHSFNTAPCDDGSLCTLEDACSGGVCAGAKALNCDDEDPCTDDSCHALSGCQHAFNVAPCNDGNPCTQGTLCAQGLCLGGEAVSCDDNNPCTDDFCTPPTGCVHPHNTAPCDDGNACTTGDQCADGICEPGGPTVCNDLNPCTDDVCDVDVGCLALPNTAPCEDGDLCTTPDSCVDGQCQAGGPASCDDQNPCTDDSCDSDVGCVHSDNTLGCDDLDACTLDDLCVAGVCVGSNPPVCDDGNSCTEDSCQADVGCTFVPIVPCCGDGSVDGEEQCDAGDENGAVGLDGCSASCTLTSRYELVLRMATSGQVLTGDWDTAYTQVVEEARDCLVRFDQRVARPLHIEYDPNTLRFDFQPLAAYNNNWDAYGYVEMKRNIRAGIGGNYRRGHASYVWRKDMTQHSESSWTPAEVYLYCEREPRYTKVSSFAANGVVTEGKGLDALIELVADQGALCKVRYDSRISTAEHVEYSKAAQRIYFDFTGLHAPYNTWDAYAYVHLDPTRASLAASYRRGYQTVVHLLDRQQYGQAYSTNVPVDVFCYLWQTTKVSTDGGAFTVGSYQDAYQAVVAEGRDCRLAINDRVVAPQYIEYSDQSLIFELENQHALYDGWESFARVKLNADGVTHLETTYRRGNASTVHLKSDEQHAGGISQPQGVTLLCDAADPVHPALAMTSGGSVSAGSWANFYQGLTEVAGAHFCKLFADGRVISPLIYEYGGEMDPAYFDMVSLAAYYSSNGYEAYAGTLVQESQEAAIYSSYRRGHDDWVWQRGRNQYAVVGKIPADVSFRCE